MVVLPVDWVRYNGIEKGTEVEVVYDGALTIKPPRSASSEER